MNEIKLDNLNQPTLAWNMGGEYTSHGQRVAAMAVPGGGVYFVDLDRGLDYFFQAPLEKVAIRRAYLNNEGQYARFTGAVEPYEARRHLEKLAEQVPGVVWFAPHGSGVQAVAEQ